jgi:hypothetical protein
MSSNLRWKIVTDTAPLRHVPGVYRVQLMDPKHPDKPLALQRFMKIDLQGIVGIGETTNLANRIVSFFGAMFGTCHHSAGWTLGYIYERNPWLQRLYSTKEALRDCVRFSYAIIRKRSLKPTECRLTDAYCAVFGEPPMLVSQVPGVVKKARRRGDYFRTWMPDPGPLQQEWYTAHPKDPLTGVSCIYRVHLMDPDDHFKFFPIPRAGGTDPRGVMEIGETCDMARRKRQIRFDITGRLTSGEWSMFHHVWDLCDRLRDLFGSRKELERSLGYTCIVTPPELRRLRESQALDEYVGAFAEAPPVNSQVPGKWR